MTNPLWSMALAASVTLAAMPLVIRARNVGCDQLVSPQHIHAQPISRLGGSIVFLAYSIGIVLAAAFGLMPSLSLLPLLVCALPVFLAGIWEDVTRRLPPRERLAAALISALLACMLAGGILTRLDLPYVDDWLSFQLLAALLACFMVVGACNALNLIDGANGLAGGTALMMFGGLAVVAGHVGDGIVFVQAASMIGALAGFLFWNYPRGRVFLGDGGAYFVGFIYAQLSIQLVARNGHVSAWFVIMLAAYPIMETLYSIYRRKVMLRTPSTAPDALHLHSLVYHQVALPAEQQRADFDHGRANARVAPWLWLHGLVCLGLALAFHDDTVALLASFALYAISYVVHYRTFNKAQSSPAFENVLDLPAAGDVRGN